MESKTPRSDALAAWLVRQRWFAGKARRIEHVALEHAIPLAGGLVTLVQVRLGDGAIDRYAIPLIGADPIADALDDPRWCRELLEFIRQGGRVADERGEMIGSPTEAWPGTLVPELIVRRLGSEQSNTSVAFGNALILKHFRRLQAGIHPEQEMTRFLTERAHFSQSPPLAGWLDYRRRTGVTTTLAVVSAMVPGARDGWEWALEELREFYRRARASDSPADPLHVRAMAEGLLRVLRRLGEATGGLHRALAVDARDPAFAPENITPADIAEWARDVSTQVKDARAVLADDVLPEMPDVAGVLRGLAGCWKTRHHGDFHLGQTLYREAAADFMIIDFEGEPIRPLPLRRRKHSPLRDVAGMLRSFDYAAVAAAPPGLDSWAHAWETEARLEFLVGYRTVTSGARSQPGSEAEFSRATAAFELEKAAYEIVYEANHRPDWVGIPTRALVRAAAMLDDR